MSKNKVVDLLPETIIKRKVRFDLNPKIYILNEENLEYRQTRQKYWEFFAIDRYRFQKRINSVNNIINHILDNDHRRKIYQERFSESMKDQL